MMKPRFSLLLGNVIMSIPILFELSVFGSPRGEALGLTVGSSMMMIIYFTSCQKKADISMSNDDNDDIYIYTNKKETHVTMQ